MGCCLSIFDRKGYEMLHSDLTQAFVSNKSIDPFADQSLGIPEDEDVLAIIAAAGKDEELHLSDEELENYMEKLKTN